MGPRTRIHSLLQQVLFYATLTPVALPTRIIRNPLRGKAEVAIPIQSQPVPSIATIVQSVPMSDSQPRQNVKQRNTDITCVVSSAHTNQATHLWNVENDSLQTSDIVNKLKPRGSSTVSAT